MVAAAWPGQKLPAQQLIDLEKVFMGGALVVFKSMEKAADLPGDQALKVIEDFDAELERYANQLRSQVRQRN